MNKIQIWLWILCSAFFFLFFTPDFLIYSVKARFSLILLFLTPLYLPFLSLIFYLHSYLLFISNFIIYENIIISPSRFEENLPRTRSCSIPSLLFLSNSIIYENIIIGPSHFEENLPRTRSCSILTGPKRVLAKE